VTGGSDASLLRDWLRRGRTVVLDGATGTELERQLGPLASPAWSAEVIESDPQLLQTIHLDYCHAGADIAVAATFRVNPRALLRAGMNGRGETLTRRAIELARAGGAAVVAASVGPAADCYRPDLVPDDHELRTDHAQRMEWIAAAGCNLAWIETINCVREAGIAAECAKARGVGFGICFVTRESGHLLSGEPVTEALKAVERSDPIFVGLNCIPPSGISRQLPAMRAATARPIAVYANLHRDRPLPEWSFAEFAAPSRFAKFAAHWHGLGAGIIGGCCGTTVDHIRALARRFDRDRNVRATGVDPLSDESA